jgi:electron transfer flavoprotein beta subunit
VKIVVLVKEVPDTYGERHLSLETGLSDRAGGERVLDEIGERALEVALSHADANAGTEVVVLSMGPESAVASVRKGLAMGAASAIQVVDPALAGADIGLTATVLSAALRRIGFDLVITGNQSTDGMGGALAPWLSELLSVPGLTSLSAVEISDAHVAGTRVSEDATMRVSAPLPAVISITDALPDGRFPNFKGIMAAKKKPFETLTLADLGVDAADPEAASSIVIRLSRKPPREAGVKIQDEGDAGDRLAQFLVDNRLV